MPVQLWTAITTINEVVGVYETLKSFVINEMAELVTRMGEMEYKAAVKSLRDIKTIDERLSEAKKGELRDMYILNAILALKLAHERFEAAIPKGMRRWVWSTCAARDAYARICSALVLQATCFGALGDWTNAAIQFGEAVLVFEEYAKPALECWRYTDGMRLSSVHPRYDRPASKEESLEELERIDFLRRKLKELEAMARR
jgi:hypothetical protein